MQYGLLGEHLPHSFSQEIHARIGRYDYHLCEVAPQDLPAFLEKRDFLGLNVTIPYKQAVIPYLAEMSGRARVIGAVNTVVNRGGRLFGDNTDLIGMKMLMERMGLRAAGKKALVLGTGGTSKTACAVARALGAREVLRVSRTGREGALSYEEAYAAHADAQLLINTTPCGMFPRAQEQPADLSRLPALEGVVDAVYNPLRTRLVLDALSRGIPAAGGLYMLVAQATAAAEVFLGQPLEEGLTEAIYRQIAAEKENIVLIGMPGAGKSTIGALTAGKLGRPLIELDEEIVQKTGMPITQFFRERGEPAFRALESELIARYAQQGGLVISTGGGAVLAEANRTALRQNGRVFFLDRPLAELKAASERPLADDMEKIRRLYAEREAVYRKAMDVRIPVHGTPEQTAEQIWREYQ